MSPPENEPRPPVFHLSGFLPTEYLVQAIGMAQVSGCLVFESGRGRGKIHFRGGVPVRATCGGLSGPGAFVELVNLRGARIEFMPVCLVDSEPMSVPMDALLLQAVRHRDEAIESALVPGESTGSVPALRIGAGSPPILYHLRQQIVTVGRGWTNQITVVDDTVSREHAILEVLPEGVILRDLGSENGTFVNGIRTGDAVLDPHDLIHFGAVAAHFLHDAWVALETPGGSGLLETALRLVTRRLPGALPGSPARGDAGETRKMAIPEGLAG